MSAQAPTRKIVGFFREFPVLKTLVDINEVRSVWAHCITSEVAESAAHSDRGNYGYKRLILLGDDRKILEEVSPIRKVPRTYHGFRGIVEWLSGSHTEEVRDSVLQTYQRMTHEQQQKLRYVIEVYRPEVEPKLDNRLITLTAHHIPPHETLGSWLNIARTSLQRRVEEENAASLSEERFNERPPTVLEVHEEKSGGGRSPVNYRCEIRVQGNITLAHVGTTDKATVMGEFLLKHGGALGIKIVSTS